MALTGDPIASITLVSAASSVTFSGIPQNYTDLLLVVAGRTSWTTDNFEGLRFRFNGDSGTNYSRTYLLHPSISIRVSNSTSGEDVFNHSGSSNTHPSCLIANIGSYSNSNTFKTMLSQSGGLANQYPISRTVNLWRSTTAITSITLSSAQSANLAAGFVADLYGLRGA
jgi:hypothetical protein